MVDQFVMIPRQDSNGPPDLVPLAFVFTPDMIHIFKNAEIAGLRAGLGGGIHPPTNLEFADLMSGVLFQFAHLTAQSTFFRDTMK
jgi:hypothetical protein